MSRINHNSIRTSFYQCFHTIQCINCNTDTCSHTQTALSIFTSHRFVFCLRNILVCNQTNKLIVFVNNRKFLYFVFLQDLCSGLQISCLIGCNNIFFCHYFIDALVLISFKTQIAIGNIPTK